MRRKYNGTVKTVGGQTAQLLASLYDRSQTMFTLADVEHITGLRGVSARTLIHKASKRGLVVSFRATASMYGGFPVLNWKGGERGIGKTASAAS